MAGRDKHLKCLTPKEVRFIRGALLRLGVIIENSDCDDEFLEQSRHHFSKAMALTDRLLEN